MAEARQMLTRPDGPTVIAAKTLRALLAIRREKLVPELYGQTVISQSNWNAVVASPEAKFLPASPEGAAKQPPGWLFIGDDRPDQPLPERLANYELTGEDPTGIAELKFALFFPASLGLLDGRIKKKAR